MLILVLWLTEIDSLAQLEEAFGQVSKAMTTLTSASYIIGYCSLSRALRHEFAAQLGQSRVTVSFHAGSFVGECDQESLEACVDCRSKLQVSPDKQLLSCNATPPQPERGGPSVGLVLGIVFGLLFFFALLVAGYFIWRKYKNDGYVWSPLVL